MLRTQDTEHGDMWGEMDTAVIIRTLESAYQASGDAAVVQSMVSHLSEKVKTLSDTSGGLAKYPQKSPKLTKFSGMKDINSYR